MLPGDNGHASGPFLVDHDGRIWFQLGSSDAEGEHYAMASFDGEHWDTYLGTLSRDGGTRAVAIDDMALAPDGSIWVVGEDGVFGVTPAGL